MKPIAMEFEGGFPLPVGSCGEGFSASCSCQSFVAVIEPGMAFNASSYWFSWWVCYLKGFGGYFPGFVCSLRFLLWRERVSVAGKSLCECVVGGLQVHGLFQRWQWQAQRWVQRLLLFSGNSRGRAAEVL